jgi:beta-glucosidase
VELINTGTRSGKAVLQLYLERLAPSAVDRPVRWLAGFATVVVAAESPATVEIPVSWRRFAHWDGAWLLEPGDFRIHAGLSIEDLHLSRTITVTTFDN